MSGAHVQIRTLNAQGVETIYIHIPPGAGAGADADVVVDDVDGWAVRVSMASERPVRKLKKVKIESSQSSVQLCAVCLGELSVGTEATCMPCSHPYHENCILKWLEKRNSCPLCRFELPSS